MQGWSCSFRKFCMLAMAAFVLTPGLVLADDSPLLVQGPVAINEQSGEPFRGTNAQPVPGPGMPPPILQPFDFVEEE